MIYYKTEEEIEFIKQSCLLVSRTHAEVAKNLKEGVSTLTLDKIAEEFIRDNKAVPGFLNYHGFPNTLCISVNDVVVHGIPSNYELKNGDIVSIDCGTILNGFWGDSAYTYGVGEISEDDKNLLRITKESLYKGIEKANESFRLGDLSFAIQEHAEKHGFSVVREMVGHGVGKNLHEKPEVANYGKRGRGIKLKEGLVIAIEPMINMGRKEIKTDRDGWTVRTIDKKNSAHFEHTVAVRKGVAEVLTTFKYIEEVLNK